MHILEILNKIRVYFYLNIDGILIGLINYINYNKNTTILNIKNMALLFGNIR